MSIVRCGKEDCTVGVTGTCLLAHSPATACPHYQEVEVPDQEMVIRRPTAASGAVYTGQELGSQDAAHLMAARYGHLVALLGDTDAGKTCFLCATYLLASCGELQPRWTFAGSRTLPGFETRLRLLREWAPGGLPEKMVDHTVLEDHRQPGLLHLLFQDRRRGVPLSLFLTDLPGEWSKSLVARAASAERFSFARRADSIILALDTGRFQERETKHVQLQWARLLLERLSEAVGVDRNVPLVLMLTKGDLHGMGIPDQALRLQESAFGLGFGSTRIVPVASFSREPSKVASGTGITTVLEAITAPWPEKRATVFSDVLAPRFYRRFHSWSVGKT